MKILIVEDEYKLVDAISGRLNRENYEVDITTDDQEGLDKILDDVYGIAILGDWNNLRTKAHFLLIPEYPNI